jgi:eukaryotic-like serine/threonine-protein kinase
MLEGKATCELPWWEDARSSWLESELPETVRSESSFVTIEVQAEPLEQAELDIERVSVNFLSPAAHPELLGRIGRYDVERIIGVGGMGVVLKAYDSELHRVVAIKVLAEHLANNSSARKRFAREAQAAAAVVHANVIPIFNVETDGKHPFLVMQCVSGGSLQAKVDAQGPLAVEEALRVVKQTAAGLAAAHQQGLVHRDVKPANILLEENVERVLLSDFGLARAVDDASLTRTGVVVGTPHYMSPEQANGDAVQHASDQFSLGSVIYFMLTGHPPFRAQTAMGVLNRICHSSHRPLAEVNSSVPIEVAQLVDRLLAKDPTKRFASLDLIEQEADRLLSALQSGKLSLSSRPLTAISQAKTKSNVWATTKLLGMLVIMAAAAWLGRNIAVNWSSGRFTATGSANTAGSAQHNKSSISVRQLQESMRLLKELENEANEFSSDLAAVQHQAMLMERTFSSPTVLTIQAADFQDELEQLKEQLNSASTQWKEP